MSSGIKVNADNLHDEVMHLLDQYGEIGLKALNLAVEDEANEIRKEVRHNVKSSGIRGKKYAGRWQIKKNYRPNGVNCTIYAGSEQPLVHLLEKGHEIKHGGTVVGEAKPFPHVSKATKDMDRSLERRIQENLNALTEAL